MIEHAVQYDPNAQLTSIVAQRLEILFCAKTRIYHHVISRVVFVIAGCQKYRVQINRSRTHALQVKQLLSDSLKCSAKERPVCHFAFFILHIIWQPIPILFDDTLRALPSNSIVRILTVIFSI